MPEGGVADSGVDKLVTSRVSECTTAAKRF
jgi:hypothetical protein